ncbi:MAG: hypothetical protein JSR87_09380 [Proteobacteria bacterium]|nr:hypothetical protein [Pseudomonadota bacterium]MBS0574163.1 hypothetical protein [Pseudomonadota bacterium]
MPEIPRALRHPPFETPVLEWWANSYDHVFAALNPFFRVPGFTPETAPYGPTHVTVDISEGVEAIVAMALAGPLPGAKEPPKDFADIIKATGVPVRWSEVADALGVTEDLLFHRTVWLWTLGSDRDDMDKPLAARLTDYCGRTGTYRPEEDQLPAVLEPQLGAYLTALGIGEVTIWDEFFRESLKVSTDAFAADHPAHWLESKCSTVAAPGFLLAWDFDDVAGLLALTNDLHNKCDPAEFFEGFCLGPNDYCDIFNPVEMFERLPALGH